MWMIGQENTRKYTTKNIKVLNRKVKGTYSFADDKAKEI